MWHHCNAIIGSEPSDNGIVCDKRDICTPCVQMGWWGQLTHGNPHDNVLINLKSNCQHWNTKVTWCHCYLHWQHQSYSHGNSQQSWSSHDDIIKWKHFPRNWPFVWGIHRSLVNSPHKGQWCGALMFSLICAWINDWVNNREAGDLRCYRAHHDVIVM